MQTSAENQTKTCDETADILADMLTENTGKHFLDSGMDNGRHWQINQGRAFEAEPETALRFDVYNGQASINVTHNVYHWLKERLDYAPEMDKLFQRFAALPSQRDSHWPETMLAFCEALKVNRGKRGEEVTFGIYSGDDHTKPDVINTYNGAEMLSQVLQFVRFHAGHDSYVLLQIHGGADVRGGYTRPRIFEESRRYELPLFDVARGTISCADCESYWTTDDAYHWYAGGACGYGAKTQLEKYDAMTLEPGQDWQKGKLCVDAAHRGMCPHCGGILHAST